MEAQQKDSFKMTYQRQASEEIFPSYSGLYRRADSRDSHIFGPSSRLPTESRLPDMSVFSQKRRYQEYQETLAPSPSPKVSRMIPPPLVTSPSSRYIEDQKIAPIVPPIYKNQIAAPTSPIPPMPPKIHTCGKDCRQCSGLSNLDIAAFYWSMLAMRGYPQIKASSITESPPSPPAASPEMTFSKPASPSGSLSSLESEPLSPSSSVSSVDFNMNFPPPSVGPPPSSVGSMKDQKCQVCHKTYSHPRLLNRHMQSHTPYKKHHCPRCRKGFNDAFDLKRHIRTHTGIKPFQCSMCDKSFTQRCSLEAHLTRVHSVTQKFAFRERRPKLFVCEGCGETFNDNTQFRQHEKTCRNC